MTEARLIGFPIDVYRNLERDCLSVQSRETESYGRVIEHVDRIVVEDAAFVVQEAGRQRVLDEERKNVHAFVRGTWGDSQPVPDQTTEVTYDPYEYDSFVECETERAVSEAQRVIVTPTTVHAVDVEYQ